MKIPDYLSPIIGYRVWFWNNNLLASLNGEPWLPYHPLKATCAVSPPGGRSFGPPDQEETRRHEAPQRHCSCGVYATKYPDSLHGMFCRRLIIAGEVFLWGTVVEHEVGWRAQFAYPKSLLLTRAMIPYGAKTAESFLAAITEYGADVFLAGAEQNLVLWKKHCGYNRDGLDVLLQVAQSAPTLRIAILSDKKERVSFLRQQVELSGNQEIVFSEAILPLAAMDAFSWDLRRLGVRIVVFDCQNLEDNLSSIRAIRENAGDVAIIAITPDVGHGRVMAALEAGVDEILSSADARSLPMHLTEYSWSWQTTTKPVNLWGGILNPPSGTAPPGGLTPPTASVWVPWGSGPRPIRPRGVALPIPADVLVA